MTLDQIPMNKDRSGDIFKMERLAKDEGFDSFRFTALFPIGPKACTFIDAYFGLLKVDGFTEDGSCTSVKSIDQAFPDLQCIAPPKKL